MTGTAFDREDITRSSGVTAASPPSQTMASIAREYAWLRARTRSLDADVEDHHRQAQTMTLDLLARDKVRTDVQSLLRELSVARGMGWSDIARLVGVSVQGLRKWRQGEPASPANRFALARLAAFLDLLDQVPVVDLGGWLEIRVLTGYALTHADVYRMGRPDLLFELANLRLTPEQALDELDPAWRERWRLENEVFEAEDGQLSVRRRHQIRGGS